MFDHMSMIYYPVILFVSN